MPKGTQRLLADIRTVTKDHDTLTLSQAIDLLEEYLEKKARERGGKPPQPQNRRQVGQLVKQSGFYQDHYDSRTAESFYRRIGL